MAPAGGAGGMGNAAAASAALAVTRMGTIARPGGFGRRGCRFILGLAR